MTAASRTSLAAAFAAFAGIAASAATLTLALAPALASQPGAAAEGLRVVELPRVVITGTREPRMVELPRVVVGAKRDAALAGARNASMQPLMAPLR